MERKKRLKDGRKIRMGILLCLLLMIGAECMNQMENKGIMIDEKHDEKTAHNLKENIESIKQNSNPELIHQNEPLSNQKYNILNDQHQISTIQEEKLELNIPNDVSEIINLNEKNFNEFLSQNIHVMINFFTKECEYCEEFSTSLSEIKKRLNDQNVMVMIVSLEFTEETEHIFIEYNIEAVPEIRYFYQGKPSKYTYSFIEYSGEEVTEEMQEWIKRLNKVHEFEHSLEMSYKLSSFGRPHNRYETLYIMEVQSLEEISEKINENTNKKVIMMNCSYQWKEAENKELGEFLKKSFLTHLDHDFYCTQNHSVFSQPSTSTFISLPTTEIFLYVYEFKSSSETHNIPILLSRIRLNNNIPYKLKLIQEPQEQQSHFEYVNLSFIYHENMNRYFNQKVEYWTNHSVMNVFTYNQPCFIMIINDETLSKKLFMKYEDVKQKLNKNPKFPPIKFYYTDLSLTAQSTTRIKKFISGLQTSISSEYPYPLLAYLKPAENRIKKFLYEGRVTEEGMEKWIVDIINEVEIEKEAIENIETEKVDGSEKMSETKEYFRSTPESLFPSHYTEKFREIYYSSEYSFEEKVEKLKIPENFIGKHNEIKLINYYDMQVLLSDLHQKDFFVYVNWKNEIKAYEELSDITEWWESLNDERHKKNEKSSKHEEKQTVENKILEEGKAEQIKMEVNAENQIGSELPNTNNIEHNKNIQIAENINNERKLIEKDTKNEEHQAHSIEPKPEHSLNLYTEEELLNHYAQKTNIYVLNYNNNDYPPVYWDSEGKEHELKISHVPSILYFSGDRKMMDKIEGISGLHQVKMFILHQFKLQENSLHLQEIEKQEKKEIQEVTKVENTESAERELSGVFDHEIIFKKE